jgi:hypothetical protein
MTATPAEIKEKFAMIERWESSGMSQVGFCRKESIQFWKFYEWLKKYREQKAQKVKPDSAGKFIKLSPTPKTFIGGVYAEVVFQNGISIRFHQPISSAELKQFAGV